MGIYSDLATGSVSIDPAKPRVGLDRSSAEQLLSKAAQFDPGVGSAYAAQAAVSRIAAHTGTVTDGTYTLTITIPTLGVEFTTAALNHDDADTVIEAAIDTASPASVPDGDLAVTEEGTAGLQDGYIDIVAEDAIADMPVFVTIDGSNLVGGGAGEVTLTTAGQTDRKATQALFELNVVAGTLQNSGEAVTDWTKGPASGQSRPRAGLIKDLARQTIEEDGTDDAYNAIAALYTLPR